MLPTDDMFDLKCEVSIFLSDEAILANVISSGGNNQSGFR